MAEVDEEAGVVVEPEASPANEQEKKKRELIQLAQLPDVDPRTLPPKDAVPLDEEPVVVTVPEAITTGVPGKGVALPRPRPTPLPRERPTDLDEPYDPTADRDVPDPTFVEKVVRTVNRLSPKQVNQAVRQIPTVRPGPPTPRLGPPPVQPSAAPATVPAGPRGPVGAVRADPTSNNVDAVIRSTAAAAGMSPAEWKAIASIESSLDPTSNANKGTQYKGLYQVNAEEMAKGGGGDIYNARDNAQAAARAAQRNIAIFQKQFGRRPDAGEIYLMHQQGPGFYTRGAMTNIAGNMPPSLKGRDPSTVTHREFEAAWKGEVSKRAARYRGLGTSAPPPGELASVDQTFKGTSQTPGNMAYLSARGGHNIGTGVSAHPTLISALTQAGRDYEAATGQKARFGQMGRDYATQAKYYARYLAGSGGLAAPPGRSRHQAGNAVDVPMGSFNAWLKANAGRYGLETLTGDAYKKDPVHFQLIGTGSKPGSGGGGAAPLPGAVDPNEVQPQTVVDPATGDTIIINEAPDAYTPPTRYPDPETKVNPFTPTPISFVPPGGATPSQNAQQTMDQSGFQQKLMDTIAQLTQTAQIPGDAYSGKYRGKTFKPGDKYDEEDAFRENVDKDMEALRGTQLGTWFMQPFNNMGNLAARGIVDSIPAVVAAENRPGGPLDPSVIHTDPGPGEPVLPQEPPPVSGSPPQAQLPTQHDERASALAALAPSPLKAMDPDATPTPSGYTGRAPGGLQFGNEPRVSAASPETAQAFDTALALSPELRASINTFFGLPPNAEKPNFRLTDGKPTLNELIQDLATDWENAAVPNPLYTGPSWKDAFTLNPQSTHNIPGFLQAAVGTVVRNYRNLATYLNQHYGLLDMADERNWTPENARKLDQAYGDIASGVLYAPVRGTLGVASGMLQTPTIALQGMIAPALAAAGATTGIETFNEMAAWTSANAEYVNKWIHDSLIKPEDEGLVTGAGEFKGTVLGFSRSLSVAKNLKTAGMIVLGDELVQQLHKLPDIPSVPYLAQQVFGVTPAQAEQVIANANPVPAKGTDPLKDFYLVDTPGGKVAVQKANIMDMAKLGLLSASFLAGPGVLRHLARREWFLPRGLQSIGRLIVGSEEARPLKGYPEAGNMVQTTPKDYSVAMGLSPNWVNDVYTRAFNEQQRLGRIGINDIHPAEIMATTHIYSNSMMQGYVSSAMEIGRMQSPHMAFNVAVPFRDVVAYADANPQFREYLRLQQAKDEFVHGANQIRDAQARGASPAEMARLQERYPDWRRHPETNNPITVHDVQRDIRDIEQAGTPGLQDAYRAYLAINTEGKRFVSDGRFAKEDPNILFPSTNHVPATSVFKAVNSNASANSPRDRYLTAVWDEVVRGGSDPLHVLERDLQTAMYERMHNELNGRLITGLPRRALVDEVGPGQFLDPAELQRRKGQIDPESLMTYKLRGVIHTFITDPMLAVQMTSDAATFRGGLDVLNRRIKKPFEKGTTGAFQPPFSVTAAIRTWWQSLQTNPEWASRAGPLSIGGALVGQAGEWATRRAEAPIRAASQWLANTSLGGFLTTPQQADAVARWLVFHQAREWSREFQAAGGKSPDILRNATYQRDYITRMKQQTSDPAAYAMLDYMGRVLRPPWNSIQSGLRNVTDVVPYAWAKKNYYAPIGSTSDHAIVRGLGRMTGITSRSVRRLDPAFPGQNIPMSMSRLAAEHRRLTGDPSERGSKYYEKRGVDQGPKELPFQTSGRWSETKIGAGKLLGTLSDAWHAAIPWSGVLIRSPAASVNAMANNPIRSMFWIGYTQMMPEMMAYFWNTQQGPEHIDYMMNRPDHLRDNHTYVARPGHRPEDGYEIPNFQEGRGARALITGVLDVLLGRSSFTLNEERREMLSSFLRVNLTPPIPPAVSYLASQMNIVLPTGIFGTAWTPRSRGMADLNPPENDLEKLGRVAIPSMADYWLQGVNSAHAHIVAHEEAGTHETPTQKIQNTVNAFGWGLYSAGHRMLQRTSVIGEAAGVPRDTSGSNRVTNEMFARKKVIDDLIHYMPKADDYIPTKPGSASGGQAALERMGPELNISPDEYIPKPGMPQPMPKNPLYTMALGMLKDRFQKDASHDKQGNELGGRGFKTMMKRYRQFGDIIDSMRSVYDGNAGPWLEKQKAQDPQQWKQMQASGVDTNNHRAVLNYYVTNRNKVAAHMFYYIKQVEWDIDQIPAVRQELGPDKHFTMEMADPRVPGLKKDKAPAVSQPQR